MTRTEKIKLVKNERDRYQWSEFYKDILNKYPDDEHAKTLYRMYTSEWSGLFNACLLLMGESGYAETLAELEVTA